MTTLTARDVENLKSDGLFFTAGAMQFQLGHALSYGCHYGLRSTRDHDVAEFRAGYEAAQVGAPR